MELIKISKVDNAIFHRRGVATMGTLHLTAHHLIFTSKSRDFTEFWLVYPMISTVIKNSGSTLLSVSPDVVKNKYPMFRNKDLWTFTNLKIICKDFVVLSIDFFNHFEAQAVYDSLVKLTVVSSINKLFAFTYQCRPSESIHNGWDIYNVEREFIRQGTDLKNDWRISTVNEKYELSSSYPKKLLVPIGISDSTLRYCAKFRAQGRIPVLTYHYKKTNCNILRSSQPLPGITKQRSHQDEKLLRASFKLSRPKSGQVSDSTDNITPLPTASKNLIIDARPRTNALGQIVLGGGTENMDYYNFGDTCSKIFLGIDNIHAMSNSLNHLVDDYLIDGDLVSEVDNRNLNTSKAGQWLRYVHLLLQSTERLVKAMIFNHSNILIHCSDGWDRTAQISSLTQICLDPYYRTIEGFAVLIEKDWVSFGHKFLLRSGHLSDESYFYDNCASDSPNSSVRAAILNRRLSNGEFSSQEHVEDLRESILDDQSWGVDTKKSPSSKFMDKISKHLLSYNKRGNLECSPIFLQFLDCVYQLVQQAPNSFEFNEKFLRRLVYHSYSCQFGTFLTNCEKEKFENGIPTKTQSVWNYFMSKDRRYTNPNFLAEHDQDNAIEDWILPNLKSIDWWWQLYGVTGDDDAKFNIEQQANIREENLEKPLRFSLSNINMDFFNRSKPN